MSSSTRSPSKSSDLSPELSERLKPDHRQNRDHHDFHRRRHHRRPNKRGRRQPWHHSSRLARSPRSSRSPEPTRSSRPRSRSPGDSRGSPMKNTSHAHGSRHAPKKNLVLRPTKGPLLNAPKNSTQFIIEDHEPFLDTEVSPKKYNTRSRSCSSSRRVSASEASGNSPGASPEKPSSAVTSSTKDDCQATPGNYVVNDDDYTYWAEYNERDFQSVYESAHQEQVIISF